MRIGSVPGAEIEFVGHAPAMKTRGNWRKGRSTAFCLSSKGHACYFPHAIVRRFLASLVLSVIAWGTLAPLLMASGDATPVCCRRDGKHRCQMETERAGSAATRNPILRANARECPYRSLFLARTASALLHVEESLASSLPEVDFVSLKTIRSLVLFFSFSLGQRGPPPSSF